MTRDRPRALDGPGLAAGIVRTIREPLLVLDGDLRVVTANPAFFRTFHIEREAVLGRFIYDLDDGQWDIEELRAVLEDIIPQDRQLENHLVEQEFERLGHRVMLLNARQLRAQEGEEMILLAIEDITDRIEHERRLEMLADDLRRSNEELERFAYVASHDLQEPLRMIASYTKLLARRYEGELDERADKYIGYAVEGAERMRLLINDLLEYSRVGRRGAEFEPVDLEDVLADVRTDLRIPISRSKAEITHDTLPTVSGDRAQLEQVMRNLISNAIKFSGESRPRIGIDVSETDDSMWRLGVHDNGIGIDPEFFDRVFVLFQRLHTREDYEGTGIGLALCRKIVERHGGRMWVSARPEGGSSFYFTLPKLECDD